MLKAQLPWGQALFLAASSQAPAMSLSSCLIYHVLYLFGLLHLQSPGTDQREFHKQKQFMFAHPLLHFLNTFTFWIPADHCHQLTAWNKRKRPWAGFCVHCSAGREAPGHVRRANVYSVGRIWATQTLCMCIVNMPGREESWQRASVNQEPQRLPVVQATNDQPQLLPVQGVSGGRMNAATSFRFTPMGPDLHWRYLTEHDPKYEGKKKLKISGRDLASVPAQVFGLDQLQALEMSPERESCLRYRMELLPREISRLKNLTHLYMDSNNLKKIPAEIGTLRHLERLTLSNNHLSSLPPEMGALQRLHSLHLANNSLTHLPAALCQLRSLTFLDLSDNKIRIIPSSIRQLEKLETLLLLFNSLENLPEDVCLLRNLRTLWLGNNRLRSLPPRFGELVNLDWGYNYCSCNFEGNPLESPPPEVCSRGSKGIRDYFLSFHRVLAEQTTGVSPSADWHWFMLCKSSAQAKCVSDGKMWWNHSVKLKSFLSAVRWFFWVFFWH